MYVFFHLYTTFTSNVNIVDLNKIKKNVLMNFFFCIFEEVIFRKVL
jgi:hypothetical protein